MARPPSSVAEIPLKEPAKSPTAVLHALTMTTSYMESTPFFAFESAEFIPSSAGSGIAPDTAKGFQEFRIYMEDGFQVKPNRRLDFS